MSWRSRCEMLHNLQVHNFFLSPYRGCHWPPQDTWERTLVYKTAQPKHRQVLELWQESLKILVDFFSTTKRFIFHKAEMMMIGTSLKCQRYCWLCQMVNAVQTFRISFIILIGWTVYSSGILAAQKKGCNLSSVFKCISFEELTVLGVESKVFFKSKFRLLSIHLVL